MSIFRNNSTEALTKDVLPVVIITDQKPIKGKAFYYENSVQMLVMSNEQFNEEHSLLSKGAEREEKRRRAEGTIKLDPKKLS